MSEKNKPVRTLRMGALKASIWANESDNRKFYNVTFSRSWRDEKKEWHESDSYGADDLLPLAKLADLAHTQIFKLREEDKKAAGGKDE
jgi:hypothetical protein